ncbi:MAG: flagellar biosynthesis protein FlgL [Xanthobacteraceae bacterium]
MTTIYGYATRATLTARTLTQMRSQLDDLARQLATGKRSETFSGLGLDRGLDLEVRMRLSRIASYENSIGTVDLRVTLMNTSLERLRGIGQEMRGDTRFPVTYELVGGGQTAAQRLAGQRFDEALSRLNERAGDRYLFAGRATDARATDTAKRIIDGDGVRAGLKQVISERLQADHGADERGRLLAPTAALSVVTLEEDDPHPFGFKLVSASTDFGAMITPDAGPPPSIDIDLGVANPPEGGVVRVTLTLPDGTTKDIELTATTEAPPPAGSFEIGATVDDTAVNLAAAIDTEIQRVARIDLAAASAIRASEDFFAIDVDNPPQRVDGPPFDTAMALVDGTENDTIFWYMGDAGTDDPRSTAVARVDDEITVAYGVRANEDGIRQVVQHVAVFAAMTFSDTDPEARERYFALVGKIGSALDQPTGVQHIEAIQTDIAGANLAAGAAQQRLEDKKPVLQGIIDEIENAFPEEVGAMLLALNTRMQASLQTTAMLSQFTLLNYI